MQLPTRVQPSTETNICSRLHQILTALLLGDFCWDQGPCMLHESSVSRDEALTNVSDASRFLTKVWGPWSCYWETSLRPNVFFPWAFALACLLREQPPSSCSWPAKLKACHFFLSSFSMLLAFLIFLSCPEASPLTFLLQTPWAGEAVA